MKYFDIKELEDIFKNIKDRFTHLNENISNNGNDIFKDRINEFSKLIFKGNELKNLISTITSDFDKIIPNIRGSGKSMNRGILISRK